MDDMKLLLLLGLNERMWTYISSDELLPMARNGHMHDVGAYRSRYANGTEWPVKRVSVERPRAKPQIEPSLITHRLVKFHSFGSWVRNGEVG
ncbi:hypothetical protein ACLOJK_027952 [Asimina triloba]